MNVEKRNEFLALQEIIYEYCSKTTKVSGWCISLREKLFIYGQLILKSKNVGN